uniref:Chitin-binding type-2 domain-containing protein n=1 Tax=Plectus sambesii TaxID=2011161 RepID=A0A914W172_9BILA
MAITVPLCSLIVFLSAVVVGGRHHKFSLAHKSFDWICKEQRTEFASLGPCSRQYLECDDYLGAIVKNCRDYEVWSNDGCISASDSYCSISTYDRDLLNSRTEQLAVRAKICDRDQGVFFAAKNHHGHEIDECSRQAIICSVDNKEASVTAVVTCPDETVLDAFTMNCTQPSYSCIDAYDYDKEHNGVRFSVERFLVDAVCDANAEYSYESKLCAPWFLDCSRREVVNCRNDHFYDEKRGECRSKHEVDSCIDETVCYGGEWSKKLSVAPCQQQFVWCRGGRIFDYGCVRGRVFDGRGCKDRDLVPECGGGTCREGETYKHDDCNKYTRCHNGRLFVASCDRDQAWSIDQQKCLYDRYCAAKNCARDGTCASSPDLKTCNEGHSFLDQEPCTGKYMDCIDGHYEERSCAPNHSWRVQARKCVYDAECYDSYNSLGVCNCLPANPCNRGHLYGHPTDCNRYFQCVDGGYVERTCESGVHEWHKKDNICTYNRHCQRDNYRICEEGVNYAHENAKLCSKYRKCKDNAFVNYECEKNFYFDTKTAQCIYDRNYVCHSKPQPPSEPAVSDGCYSVYFRHEMCNKYYHCNNGKYTEETCRVGHAYDHNHLACVPDDSCRPHTKHCKIGSYSHYPYDCRFFYQCDHGKWALRPCAPGTGWNQKLLTCDHLGNGQCY